MDNYLLKKMIQQAFKQYMFDESLITNQDYLEMYIKVRETKATLPQLAIHEIVQDVVYGFITGSPYF